MSRYDCQKRYRQKNRQKMVDYQKKYYQNPKNKQKIADRKRKYNHDHPEKIKLYRQKYYQEHKSRQADLRLRRIFKISLEEADSLLIKQQHQCPICRRSLIETKRCVDHDHKTGKVRGILCKNCNAGIGFLAENSESFKRAIQYLGYGLK